MQSSLIKLSLLSVIVCAVCLLTFSPLRAHHLDHEMWSVEFQEMLNYEKAADPGSHWNPYFQKASALREAAARGDDTAVMTELAQVVGLLAKGDIDDDAAIELLTFVNYWQRAITPRTRHVRSR